MHSAMQIAGKWGTKPQATRQACIFLGGDPFGPELDLDLCGGGPGGVHPQVDGRRGGDAFEVGCELKRRQPVTQICVEFSREIVANQGIWVRLKDRAQLVSPRGEGPEYGVDETAFSSFGHAFDCQVDRSVNRGSIQEEDLISPQTEEILSSWVEATN